MAANAQPSRRLSFDEFEVDLRSGEVWERGNRLRLQDQPFQVLRVLLERRGEIVTRDELKQTLWPADTFVDFDDGLNTAVRKIRDALGDSAEKPRYIETIPRRGYRFMGCLSDLRPAVLSSPAEESNDSPAQEFSRSDVSAPVVVPAPAQLLSIRWRVLLTAAAALALFSTGLALYRGSSAKGTSQPRIKSLAVLPLKNLSADPTQEYLADGMTEALIGRLAGIHDLRVISRTSVMQYKDTKKALPEIAKALGADAIVEGSVIRDGNRIRVHAQLIRAATDEHFWSETYDRELRDVLTLQSEVAQSIAQKVEVTITGEERARLTAARPIAPEVYESYLKGRSILDKSYSRSGLEESIGYFEEATKRDPTFAPAYVGLANAYDKLGTIFIGTPPSEVRPKVVNAARKALELDPGLAEAHVLLGDVYQEQWRWSDAQAEYQKALDLKPNDAAAHLGFAHWLLCQGRTQEALTWTERGRELDPIAVSGTSLGETLFFAHRYDEAIHELRSALAVQGDSASALWYLGFSLIAKGQPEDAIPVLEKAVSITNRSPGVIGVLIRAYAHAGRRKDALRLLEELKQRRQKGYVPAGAFVNAYLGMEDREQAFAWLEHAYQEQSNILQFLRVHPYFDPLRDDPRFKDLLHRVGLN
ncbi:MAG TPA: tetratricopeptide repeat protein [Candidatus Cybelea sp.]|nr:tetratricopeptide repeat protein [Candidatus Cybelea sp.]